MSQGSLEAFSRCRCIASETRRCRNIQQKTRSGRIQMHAWLITAQQCKRERGMRHRRSCRENDDTGGVEGLSGPRLGRVPQTRRQNSFQRKTVVYRRFTRSAHSRFTKRETRTHEYKRAETREKKNEAQRR